MFLALITGSNSKCCFQHGSEEKLVIPKKDLLIIGGGPAGISAAIWAKRLGINHLLLEAREELGGQLSSIQNKIIDYPGIIVPNGRSLQEHFNKHAQEIKFEFETKSTVKSINWNKRELTTSLHTSYQFRSMLITTGSSPRKLRIPGEQEMIDRKELYSATRDKAKFTGKNVAVIGGGDRAFEGALLLAEAEAHVFLIHRSDGFKARKEYKNPVMEHPNIKVLTHTTITKIEGIGTKQLTLSSNGTTDKLSVEGVFIRIGVEPNTEPFKEYINLDHEGYIICNDVGEASLPYVYAAGDVCTRPLLSSISSAVGQGMTAVKSLSFYLED